MAKSNLSAVLIPQSKFQLENRPIPVPAAHEVLIAVHFVGICGSDVHFWKHGAIAHIEINEPIVLGHEGSGTILKVGKDVKDLKPGDRVCIQPALPCLMCEFCKKGRYNLCPHVKCCGSPPMDGILCQYYCYHADFCHKLPDSVSLEEGALMEPLSVALHACRRASITAGSFVLICGAGAIGLLNLLVCKAMGATRICITDINENRLNVAQKLGATNLICVKGKSTQELISEVTEKIGDAPDITLECSGAEPSIRLAIQATKRGGVVVLVGLGASEITIPIVDATVREVDIRGVFCTLNCFPAVLDLVASGAIDVKPLISHQFTLKEAAKAFEVAHRGADGAIKVLINCKDV